MIDWLVLFLTVMSIETNGQIKNMRGDEGKAVGIVQIHEIVCREYNQAHKEQFTHEDCKDAAVSEKICYWYLSKWGEHYKKQTGKDPTPEVLYRIWNGGPDGWKSDKTKLRGIAAGLAYSKFELMGEEKQWELYNKWMGNFGSKPTKKK